VKKINEIVSRNYILPPVCGGPSQASFRSDDRSDVTRKFNVAASKADRTYADAQVTYALLSGENGRRVANQTYEVIE
jgi:hypothetical protein